MKSTKERTPIRVPVSKAEKEKLKRLAKILNMTTSSLGAMMIGDTINSNITKILNKKSKKSGKRNAKVALNSKYNKEHSVYVRMSTKYIRQLNDALKNPEHEYHYYVSEVAQFCISYQLKKFNILLELAKENNENRKRKEKKDEDEYLQKKAIWYGVSEKEIKNYYSGKKISEVLTATENEREIWNMTKDEVETFLNGVN